MVSLGTSSPELFVNVIAALKGTADLAVGNILGSNIFNILLTLGISSIIFPIVASPGTVWKEVPFSLLAALVFALLANDAAVFGGVNRIGRVDGAILLAFLVLFLVYTLNMAKKDRQAVALAPPAVGKIPDRLSPVRISLLILLGLVFLNVGAKWVVDGSLQLAIDFGVSEGLVGFLLVATGTSLPELVTSAVAAWQKNSSIAMGNIIGSNIFNIFCVMGLASLIQPLAFNPKTNLEVMMTIMASLLLFVFMFTGKRRTMDRWEGVVSVLLYLSFAVLLFFKD